MNKGIYRAHIRGAENKGEILRFGRPMVDPWSHLEEPDPDSFFVSAGVQPDNTRLPTPFGLRLVKALEEGSQALILGPGLGVETSVFHDVNPGVVMDTVALTPVSPRVKWKAHWEYDRYFDPRFYRQVLTQLQGLKLQGLTSGSTEPPSSLDLAIMCMESGRIGLEHFLSFQRGFGISTHYVVPEPFIRRQFIGDAWSPGLEEHMVGEYQLIYGNNCPVVKRPFGREGTLPRVLAHLAPSGVLYCRDFGVRQAVHQDPGQVSQELQRMHFDGLRILSGGLILVGGAHPSVDKIQRIVEEMGSYSSSTGSWTILDSKKEEFVQAWSELMENS